MRVVRADKQLVAASLLFMLCCSPLTQRPQLRPRAAEKNQGAEILRYDNGTGDNGDGFLERRLQNGQRFIVRHYAPHKADIIVVTSKHHYRMPDERIVETDNEGTNTVL